MLQLRSCPKCGTGDVAIDKDIYGWFRQCIQCGYIEDLPEAAVKQIVIGIKNKAETRKAVEVAA